MIEDVIEEPPPAEPEPEPHWEPAPPLEVLPAPAEHEHYAHDRYAHDHYNEEAPPAHNEEALPAYHQEAAPPPYVPRPYLVEVPEEPAPGNRSPRKWLYAGVAALISIGVLVGVTRKPAPFPPSAATPPPVKWQAPEPVAQAPATPKPSPLGTRSAPPAPVRAPQQRQAPAARAVVPDSPSLAARKADGWWVIVGAYNSREAAEKRVSQMSKRWPNFHIALSEPKSEKTRYVITLGENLSADQAEALRKRAVAAGLPRDTYIKRIT